MMTNLSPLTTPRLSEINSKIRELQNNRVPTNKWDYGKLRETRELALQEAQKKLSQHKSLADKRDKMYPTHLYTHHPEITPDIMYSNDYIRFLENVIKCKRELELLDLSLEGLLLEKINILEELAVV
jgi:hypothetical protein